eukprot:7381383-Prymnesium_polylepis.1
MVGEVNATERVCASGRGEGGFCRAGLGLRASATSSGSSMERRRRFPVTVLICTICSKSNSCSLPSSLKNRSAGWPEEQYLSYAAMTALVWPR